MKRKFKRIASLVLAMVMVFAMAMPAMATSPDNPTTGSITISDSETVKVAGRTFNVYKILDVTMTTTAKEAEDRGYAYTVPDYMKGFFAARFNLNQAAPNYGQLVSEEIKKEYDAASDKDAWLQSFAKAVLSYLKGAGQLSKAFQGTDTGDEGATEVKIEDLPFGYYLVEDATAIAPGETGQIVSALMLRTTDPYADVTIKADLPKIEKKIDEIGDTSVGEEGNLENTGDDVKSNNKKIGDTINYVVEGNVPDMTGYESYKYVVSDTMTDGLTLNESPAKFTVQIGDQVLTIDRDYVLEASDHGFTITFKNFIQWKDRKGEVILVKYSAVLNENAVLGTSSNDNTVNLTYSNDPNQSGKGEDGEPKDDNPEGKTPDSVTKTYTTGIQLLKIEGDTELHHTLAGAEFTIEGTGFQKVFIEEEEFVEDEGGTYYKLKNGTYTETAPGEGDNSEYENVAQKYKLETTRTEKTVPGEKVSGKAFVDDNGILRFVGLNAGTYTITEVTAPDGYNMLKGPIEVTIAITDDQNSEKDVVSWSISGYGEDVVLAADGIFHIEVENNTGAELPETGGIGTTIFYVVGSVLVLAAVILLVTKRRMKSE